MEKVICDQWSRITISRFPAAPWAAGDGREKPMPSGRGTGWHRCDITSATASRARAGGTGPFLLDDSQGCARTLKGMSCHGSNEY